MLSAMELAASMGKGLYGMKPLGGGHLGGKVEAAFEFVLAIPTLASVALGMKSRAELMMNLRIFAGQPVPGGESGRRWPQRSAGCISTPGVRDAAPALMPVPRRALQVVDGRCRVDGAKCVLCGYCGAACPDFALKIV